MDYNSDLLPPVTLGSLVFCKFNNTPPIIGIKSLILVLEEFASFSSLGGGGS